MAGGEAACGADAAAAPAPTQLADLDALALSHLVLEHLHYTDVLSMRSVCLALKRGVDALWRGMCERVSFVCQGGGDRSLPYEEDCTIL